MTKKSNANSLLYFTLQNPRPGQASYTHVREIVAELGALGWNVDLIEPKYSVPNPTPTYRAITAIKTTLIAVRAMLRSDCVYIRSNVTTVLFALICRLVKKTYVLEVNGSFDEVFIAWPWTRPMKTQIEFGLSLQIKWASAVVTVTEGLRNELAQLTKAPVVVIPNGANTKVFKPSLKALPNLPEKYVSFHGTLAEWQGLDTLIDATKAKAWPKTVALVIAGDGRERNKVEKSADGKRVIYLGSLSYRDTARLVSNSLCGLSVQPESARNSHGLSPLKAYEVMAAGVPIIVSDIPGMRDDVKHANCGYVVTPGDAEAVAVAVKKISTRPEEQIEMGKAGRKAAVKSHSWAARAHATDDLLREILGTRHEQRNVA